MLSAAKHRVRVPDGFAILRVGTADPQDDRGTRMLRRASPWTIFFYTIKGLDKRVNFG
jgi:hypothetical protein